MTHRLYYDDSYCTAFQAQVAAVSSDRLRVVLDQTAFYPTSGGQSHDLGTLQGVPVLDVIDQGETVEHVLAAPLEAVTVHGQVDWTRRFDHMQQHTAQHLLSAVLDSEFGRATKSVAFGPELSTVEVSGAPVDEVLIAAVERRCNLLMAENRPVRIAYEDAASAAGLRKESSRAGTLRIIAIDGLDRSACGGTHVRSTGEIGFLQLRKTEKVRGNARLSFVAGLRAANRARADYIALSQVARCFSSTLDDAPAQVETLRQEHADSSKRLRSQLHDLGVLKAERLFQSLSPDPDGVRRSWQVSTGATIPDELKSTAGAFAALSRTVFVASAGETVLLACATDSGYHAGNTLKQAIARSTGRGGGSAQLAQGTIADLTPLLSLLGFADPAAV